MKKFLLLTLTLAATLLCLVACNDHEHSFSSDTYASDDYYHWRPCTVQDDCTEKHEKTEHDFEASLATTVGTTYVCKVCGYSRTEMVSVPEHEHSYGEKLKFDLGYHWVGCVTEGCDEATERFEHVFGNPEVSYSDGQIRTAYTCVDCGFKKIGIENVSTEVSDALSWNDAFKNFKLVNFTMDVFFKKGDMTHRNHCVVTDTAAYYCIPDSLEFYTVPNGDGSYTTYARHSSTDPFTKLNDTSDTYLIGAQTETVIQVSFEDNFEKFTYDEESGSYVCEGEIESTYYSFSGEPIGTLISFNNVVKIKNGAISYIEADYRILGMNMGEGYSQSFKYENIGMSVVEIPQSVIDECIPDNGNFSDSDGGSYDEEYDEDDKVETFPETTFDGNAGLSTELIENGEQGKTEHDGKN